MVKEFTDLQGIVGGLYAKHQGEPEAGLARPSTNTTSRSAWKIDSVDAEGQNRGARRQARYAARDAFAIGMVPTGSKDPFALRRAAQGVVKILVGSEARVAHFGSSSAAELHRVPARAHPVLLPRDSRLQVRRGERGAGRRLRHSVRRRGAPRRRSPRSVPPRISSRSRLASSESRTSQAGELHSSRRALDDALLEDGPERELYDEYQRLNAAWHLTATIKRALEAIARLRPPSTFLRQGAGQCPGSEGPCQPAHAACIQLFTEFSTIADFSEIVTSGDQK